MDAAQNALFNVGIIPFQAVQQALGFQALGATSSVIADGYRFP